MKKILGFFNLLDSKGNLSITNLAVLVCVAKMSLASQFTGTEVGALIATLLNYSHKRMVNSNAN